MLKKEYQSLHQSTTFWAPPTYKATSQNPSYLRLRRPFVSVRSSTGRRPLWSADNRTCLVKRSRNQFGDRCFATAGPTLWNSLPEQLRQPDITFGQFNDRWKRSCLVSWAAAPCVWTLRALTRNILLTYLLTYLQIDAVADAVVIVGLDLLKPFLKSILVPSATVHSYNMVLIITSCSTIVGLITSHVYECVQYFACICNFSDRLLNCVTIAFIIVLYWSIQLQSC